MKNIDLSSINNLHLNILAYGEPGCGKTRFVGSVGEVLYTLLVDIDQGAKTLLQVPKKWRDNIVIAQLDDFRDLDKIYKLFEKNDPAEWTKALFTQAEIEAGRKVEKPFEAVAFDTWSEMNWEIKEEKRKLLGKGGNNRLEFRPNIEIQDWQQINDLNTMCIIAFRDLPVTFICTMHEQFMEDKKSGQIKGVPSINGKFASEVGKYFDVVGHMFVNLTGDYVMATKQHQRYQAKSRIVLDKEIKNPTFKGIIDALVKA